MKNLLYEGFYRLIKSLESWVGIFLTILFSIISIIQYVDSEITYIDEWCFTGLFFVNLISATVMGMFFFRDYSNGTLRLKIATGNKKYSIFFNNFLISIAYHFLLTSVNIITNLTMYKLVNLSDKGFNKKAAVLSIIFMFIIEISYAAITTVIGMSFQSVLCAICPALINMLMLIMISFIPSDKNNPIGRFINESLPFGQINYLSCIIIPSRYTLMLLYSLIVIISSNFLGSIILKKSNLK